MPDTFSIFPPVFLSFFSVFFLLAALESFGLAILSSLLLDNRNGQTTSGRQFYYALPTVQAVPLSGLPPDWTGTDFSRLWSVSLCCWWQATNTNTKIIISQRWVAPKASASSYSSPSTIGPPKIINCNCSVDIFTAMGEWIGEWEELGINDSSGPSSGQD